MRRKIAVAVAAGAMTLPATAAAHVSLHPNTVPAASSATWNVRVPNEEDKASTVKVDMQVPAGFLDVSTQPVPGWKPQVLKTKLAQPIKTDTGTVTEQVSEIIWTAPKGGGIPPGGFQQFPILTAVPDSAAGQTLTFKVVQTYSNGDVSRWIEAPDSSGHPAPTVNITAKGGVLQDVAGTEAGPGPAPASGSTPAAPTTKTSQPQSKGASKGLAITALIVGALGLLAALGAFAATRRRPAHA